MSLKVWLPLDGDLRNLGCSDLQFTNENTSTLTIDSAGKIGSCYKRASAKTAGRIISDKTLNLNEDLSICCWAKVTATVGDTANGLVSMHSHANNTGFGITVKQISSTDYRISCSTGNGSGRTFHTYYGTTNIKDAWHHLALTYNNTLKQFKLWVDGKLELTQSYTNASRDEYIMLFEWSTTYNAIDYRPACSLNDVRIYNHCLSAAEVHEIAMGLVLHYKLDGNGMGNPNLLANSKLDGSWTYPSSPYSDKYSPITTSIPSASQYTLSFEAKSTVNGDIIRTHYYSPNTTTTCVSSQGSSRTASDGYMTFSLTTEWKKYWVIYSQNETTAVKHVICPRLISGEGTGTVSLKNVKLEEGSIATPWCPNAADALYSTLGLGEAIVKDSSGYGHNGILWAYDTTGKITISSDTARYNTSTFIDSENNTTNTASGTHYIYGNCSLYQPTSLTCTFWCKPIAGYGGSTAQGQFSLTNNDIGSNAGSDYQNGPMNHRDAIVDINNAAGNVHKTVSINFTANEWHHYAIVYDGRYAKTYKDGTLAATADMGSNMALGSMKGAVIGFSKAGGVWRSNKSYYSDFRLYVTPLLDTDIKMLYNVGMKVDNLGEIHSFEFNENKNNLMWRPENARAAGLGMNYNEGLGSYTQSNCQVTCDSNGYRIYRPPNLTVSANGNTMWGGLKVVNSTNGNTHIYNEATDNIFGLTKGHTYIVILTVKGKSGKTASSFGWTNQMGWGGGGLSPNPSNVVYKNIGNNFNGETECYYKFTISDDVVKTCTTTYSGFTSGNQYLSYRDFMFGFGYESTESLGTDLYISNISLYDITNTNIKLNKDGTLNLSALLENRNTAKIYQSGIIESTEFIEL